MYGNPSSLLSTSIYEIGEFECNTSSFAGCFDIRPVIYLIMKTKTYTTNKHYVR